MKARTTLRRPFGTPRRAQRGFVLAYALAAVFVLSLVAGLAARLNSPADTSGQMAELRDQVLSQASLIRTKLLTCAAMYPTSSSGLPYPAFPSEANALVSDLICPGAPSGANLMWPMDDVIRAPLPVRGLSEWRYTRDTNNVIRIQISLLDGAQFRRAALTNVAARFGTKASFAAPVLYIRLN